MMRFCTLLITTLLLFSCSEKRQTEKEEVPVKVSHHKVSETKSVTVKPVEKKSKYRTVSLFEPQTGWGYDIFDGDKLLIHQPNIPVVQGLRGFRTEEDALKVADAVVVKLEQGMMPPTLSMKEMQDLGVL